jgi:hypothetical protein
VVPDGVVPMCVVPRRVSTVSTCDFILSSIMVILERQWPSDRSLHEFMGRRAELLRSFTATTDLLYTSTRLGRVRVSPTTLQVDEAEDVLYSTGRMDRQSLVANKK